MTLVHHGLHRLCGKAGNVPQVQRLQPAGRTATIAAGQVGQIFDQALRLANLPLDHLRDRLQAVCRPPRSGAGRPRCWREPIVDCAAREKRREEAVLELVA
jgi:hypothetical protein